MAVSVVSFNQTAWTNTTTPKTVTGLAWSSGDVIVVMGGLENAGAALNTPTNANLTFSLQASVTTGGSNEAAAYVWTATAGSAQTSQTISGSRGNPGQHWGFACWVLTGTSGSVANASANQTESGFTFTPTAGSAVCYFFGDWNADATGQTLATGTGTGTERADASGTQWSWYLGEWVGVTATSTTFGVTSYTGLQVAHAVIEVLASGGGSTNALAGNAAGSGVANQPTARVAPNAAAPTGAGSALQPASRVAPNAAAPTGAGSALAPTAALRVNAGLASGAGTAGQATVSTGGAATNAPAGLAAATGTAFAPTIAVQASAGVAAGVGAANQPAASVAARPAAPTGVGSAFAATVQTGTIALAGLAAAVGSAFTALVHIAARPSAATAAGTALTPTTTAETVVPLRTLALYSTRVFGADGYHTGENHTVWLPTNLPVGVPLVVVCHGTASDAIWYTASPDRYRPLEALANTGLVVVAADLGEPSNVDGWGNDLSVARIDEVIPWAATEFGCRTDRVTLLGDSAGGATALNWARQNNGRVAAVALRAGVCDIEAIYQGGAGNPLLVALIDTAYTVGGGWPAQRATHDPALNTADLVPVADRIRVYYTSGDDLIPPQSTIDFAGDVGCDLVPVGEMAHNDSVMTAIQPGDLAAWIWSLT